MPQDSPLRGEAQPEGCATISLMEVSIADFTRALRAIRESEFGLDRVHQFLRDHIVQPGTLDPYLTWDSQHYTRNLIDKTDWYELIAICWEPGQVSSIHNHHEQNCWMAAPIGRLISQNFRVIEQDENQAFCKLEPTGQFLLTPTTPLPINPAEPVHQVYNPREFGQRAVSLHIYSRPFDRCLVYSLDGKYGEIQLGYTTMYGKPVP